MVGIILIVLEVLGIVYNEITYREKVVDLGPIEIQSKEDKTLPIPEIFSGIALVAGIVLGGFGAKKK